MASDRDEADELHEERIYVYDDNGNHRSGQEQVNIQTEDNKDVYPQQMSLAINILKRIKLSQRRQGIDFQEYDKVEMQVRHDNRNNTHYLIRASMV